MPLVNERVVLDDALSRRYAVGAFNANNMEMVQGIIWAAQEMDSPVILQVSPGAIKYAGLEMAVAMVKAAAGVTSIPVALHLDHGKDFETNRQCAEAGFNGLMFDGSELLLERWTKQHNGEYPPPDILINRIQSEEALALNITATKKVVEMAHERGLMVEAEIGHIPRIEKLLAEEQIFQARRIRPDLAVQSIRQQCREIVEALMAIPQQVEYFVQETGCDSLAAAFGSIHGIWDDIWPIRLDRLYEIQERVRMPLVSHGSSGILMRPQDAVEKDIELAKGEGTLLDAIKIGGVTKVNVATILSISYIEGYDEAHRKNLTERDFRKLGGPAREAVKQKTMEYLRLFAGVV